MIYTSYLAANWDARTKLARIVDHCKTVEAIGGIVDSPPDTIVELVRLTPIDLRYCISLDQARWLLSDGQMVLSLWDGIGRIFSLQFCLSSHDGRRVAYIGGIQGRAQVDGEPNILDRYRIFTKAAGMRPRDFLIEVFKMFCRALDVSEIHAVSNLNHPQRQKVSDIKLSYDQVWRERGGVYDGNGFFILPVSRGADKDIPAKRRRTYRQRYAILKFVEAELNAVLK